MPIYLGNKKVKIFIGRKKVKKAYLGSKLLYSSGNTVTYMVDQKIAFEENVEDGNSCLHPKTFAPVKSGWEFLGWRKDEIASENVLSGLSMGDDPITLYAVFRQNITISYYGNGNTGGHTESQTGERLYNNGSEKNPVFLLRANGFERSGYIFSKWSLGGIGGSQYAEGSSIVLLENTTIYATWTPLVTSDASLSLRYNFSGADGGTSKTATLALSSAALGHTLKISVKHEITNGIFSEVDNQVAWIRCGSTEVYRHNFGDQTGHASDTKEITFAAISTVLTAGISAEKEEDENQGTQRCQASLSISNVRLA